VLEVVIRWDGGQLSRPVRRIEPLDFSFYSDRMYEYNITITNVNNQVVRFRVTLQGGLMPSLTSVVPAVLLGFGIANGVWIAYARPDVTRQTDIYLVSAAGGEDRFRDFAGRTGTRGQRVASRGGRAARFESGPHARRRKAGVSRKAGWDTDTQITLRVLCGSGPGQDAGRGGWHAGC